MRLGFFFRGGWGRENVKFLLGLIFGLEMGSIRVMWDFRGGLEIYMKEWRKSRDCKTGREEGLGLEGIGPDLGWAQFYFLFQRTANYMNTFKLNTDT